MQIEVLETVTKTIGSLALAYPYLRRLGVAETIDDLVTAGKDRVVPTGQVIEVLILNRLSLRPVPSSKIGAWAQTQAIEEVYGLAADALNRVRPFLRSLPTPCCARASPCAHQLTVSSACSPSAAPRSFSSCARSRSSAAASSWPRA